MVNVVFAVSLLAAVVRQVSSVSVRDSSLWARDVSPSQFPAQCQSETTCLPIIDVINSCNLVPSCYCTQANVQAAQTCGNCALKAVPGVVEEGYVQILFNYFSDYCLAAGYVLTPPSITVGGVVVSGSGTVTLASSPASASPGTATSSATIAPPSTYTPPSTTPPPTATTLPATITPPATTTTPLNPFKTSGTSITLASTASTWRILVTTVCIMLLARMA